MASICKVTRVAIFIDYENFKNGYRQTFNIPLELANKSLHFKEKTATQNK